MSNLDNSFKSLKTTANFHKRLRSTAAKFQNPFTAKPKIYFSEKWQRHRNKEKTLTAIYDRSMAGVERNRKDCLSIK